MYLSSLSSSLWHAHTSPTSRTDGINKTTVGGQRRIPSGTLGKMKLLLTVSLIVLDVVWGMTLSQGVGKSTGPDSCQKRYLQHYAVKDCTPVYGKDPQCPIRFQCPEHYAEENKEGCKYNGRLYKEGESVPVTNPCQICNCRSQYLTKALKVDCIGIECPSAFGPPLNSSCYRIHEEGKCCSAGIKCSNGKDDKPNAQEKVCTYKDQTYHLGQEIYSDEDPCQSCLCTKDWTDINGPGCHSYDCDLDQKRVQLQQGCLPIYHEATCCPIQYFCEDPVQHDGDRKPHLPTAQEIKSGNICTYKGVDYKIGAHIDIDNEPCVTCTCSVPPDFTCIQKDCPLPDVDLNTCNIKYHKGQCCPTIECVL